MPHDNTNTAGLDYRLSNFHVFCPHAVSITIFLIWRVRIMDYAEVNLEMLHDLNERRKDCLSAGSDNCDAIN